MADFDLDGIENIVGKGENAGYQHFLPFQLCFPKPFLKALIKARIVRKRVNPFPNKALSLSVCTTSLLKTLCQKEKLLLMSNFSFSHGIFYPFGESSTMFIKLKIVVCKHFHFGRI